MISLFCVYNILYYKKLTKSYSLEGGHYSVADLPTFQKIIVVIQFITVYLDSRGVEIRDRYSTFT